MASLSGGGDPANPTAVTTAPPSHLTKRDQAAAEVVGQDRPNKKRAVEPTKISTELGDIIIVAFPTERPSSQVALDFFSDPAVITGLRPVHYNYAGIRQWLQKVAGVREDAKIHTNLRGPYSEEVTHDISSAEEFSAVLVNLRNGHFKVPWYEGPGHTLLVLETALDPALTASVEAEPEESVTRPPPESLTEFEEPAQPAQPGLSNGDQAMPPAPPAGTATEKGKEPELSEPPPDPKLDKEVEEVPRPEKPEEDEEDKTTTVDPNASLQPGVIGGLEFFNLIRKAKGPDDEILTVAEKDEPEAENRFFQIKPRRFKRALQFFNTTLRKDGKCSLPTLHKNAWASWWQIYLAYDMFMAPVERGLAGFCVGLDVGFGKTILTLLYIRARAELIELRDEVREEHEKGTPKKHLPKDNKDPSKKCPVRNDFLVQCPCALGSADARKALRYLSDTPAMIIIPPVLQDTWTAEAKAFYNDPTLRGKYLDFYLYFGESTDIGHDISSKSKSQRGAHVKDTRGRREGGMVGEGKGHAQHVFLVSDKVLSQVWKLYQDGLYDDKILLLLVGVVFMDEFHKYKGAAADTIPFRITSTIASLAKHPVTLFPLCGTTIEEGPSAWRAPAEFYLEQWTKFGEIGTIDSANPDSRLLATEATSPEEVLRQGVAIRNAHKAILQGLQAGKMDLGKYDNLVATIRAPLSAYVVSIRKSQRWRGMVLNKLPPCHTDYLPLCSTESSISNNFSPDTIRERNAVEGSIKTLLSKRLQDEVKKWEILAAQAQNEGSTLVEAKPTMNDMIQEAGAESLKKGYFEYARLSTFPYLAVLIANKDIDAQDCASDNAQDAVVRYQHKLRNKKRDNDEAMRELLDWNMARYMDGLKDNSPKFKELLKQVKALVANIDKSDAIEDDSGIRHAVVWVTHSITAAVIYFLLLTDQDLVGKIELKLASSKVDIKVRQELVNELRRDTVPGDKNRILIAVTDVTAEGFNIQSVNNVWFVEVPGSPTKTLQAVGRSHRKGQRLEVNVLMMSDESNILEKAIRQGLAAKLKLAKSVYNVEIA